MGQLLLVEVESRSTVVATVYDLYINEGFGSVQGSRITCRYLRKLDIAV